MCIRDRFKASFLFMNLGLEGGDPKEKVSDTQFMQTMGANLYYQPGDWTFGGTFYYQMCIRDRSCSNSASSDSCGCCCPSLPCLAGGRRGARSVCHRHLCNRPVVPVKHCRGRWLRDVYKRQILIRLFWDRRSRVRSVWICRNRLTGWAGYLVRWLVGL